MAGNPVGNSDLEITPHLFTNFANDEAAPCDSCKQGFAHKAHKAAAKEAAAEVRETLTPTPGEPQPEGHETPLEDRLLEALSPLDEYDEGEASSTLESLSIADLDDATWVARRAGRLRKKLANIERVYTDTLARAAEWRNAETAKLGADLSFFEGRLKAFHQNVLAEDPKAKTVKLPDGTELSSLAGKLVVEVVDLTAFVEWCEANELTADLLRYPEPEPQKVEIAKRFKTKALGGQPGSYPAATDDGETVPGVEIVCKERSFSVKGPAE
jgi:hypothetical protein